jgi:hypothetical protein
MNLTEATILCRYVKTIIPSQLMDEFTPEGWADVMWDIPLADAKAVCAEMVRRGERFIEPGFVVRDVKKIRRDRIAKFGPLTPPPGLDDAAERAWLRRAVTAVASGSAKTPADLGLPPLPTPDPERVRLMVEAAIPRVNTDPSTPTSTPPEN